MWPLGRVPIVAHDEDGFLRSASTQSQRSLSTMAFFFFLAQRRKSPNSQGKARFWFFVQRWKDRKDLCLNEGTKGHVLEAQLTLDIFIEQRSIILQLSNSN